MPDLYRTQGDTGPDIVANLLIGATGMPFPLAGASVYARLGGTIGGSYVRFLLPATWASGQTGGSVRISLNPSGLGPNNYPCATPGLYRFDIVGIPSGGGAMAFPERETIRFNVRIAP